ncbi:MAG: hypothetical protein ABEN55_20105 [Bradymonadaceae bacterium]
MDGHPDVQITFEYDERGRRTGRKRDHGGDGPEEARPDGNPERVVRHEYDADRGVRTRTELRGTALGAKSDTIYNYDDRGRLVRTEIDFLPDGDGEFETSKVVERTYGEAGRLMSERVNVKSRPVEIYRFQYGSDGHPVRRAGLRGEDATEPFEVVTWQYDDAGHLVSEKTYEYEDPESGEPAAVVGFEYDQKGRKVRRLQDRDGNGDIEQATTWEYDDRGNTVRRTTDRGQDGSEDRVVSWRHDCS